MTERPITVGRIEQLTTTAKPCADTLDSLVTTDRAVEDARRCRLCEKPQPCSEHGRTPVTDADFDELHRETRDALAITDLESQLEALAAENALLRESFSGRLLESLEAMTRERDMARLMIVGEDALAHERLLALGACEHDYLQRVATAEGNLKFYKDACEQAQSAGTILGQQLHEARALLIAQAAHLAQIQKENDDLRARLAGPGGVHWLS